MNCLRRVRLLPVLAVVACGDATTTDSGQVSRPPGASGEDLDAGVTAPDDVDPTENFVVTRVSLFQTLEIPLHPQKDLSTVPLIAGKDTLVRVNVRPATGTTKLEKVFATVHVEDGAATPIAGPAVAVEASSDTVLDVTVPASQFTSNTKLRVKVMPQAASAASSGSLGAWPSGGKSESLAPEVSGAMHVVVVPVNTVKSTNYGRVDVTPEVLADFRKYVLATLPVGTDRLKVEAHARYDTQLTPNTDFANKLLDEIVKLHTADGAGNEVRYIALFDFDNAAFPIDTTQASALFGGLGTFTTRESVMNHTTTHPAGIARFTLGRSGIAAPWAPGQNASFASNISEWEKCPIEIVERHFGKMRSIERAYAIAVHELGHLYSLKHVSTSLRPFSAPEADETFPRPDGKIGRMGYDATTARFFEPTCFTDVMGYSNLQWISDHNYKSLHALIRGN